MESQKENGPKIGLVLSGGGARGISHIGVIKALEEHGIFPQIISGSSAGALTGAFYAAGFSVEEMVTLLKEVPYLRLISLGYGKQGMLNYNAVKSVVQKYLKGKRFEDLPKKLYVCCTNMGEGISEYFDSGEVIMPVVASCAIPVFFTPVRMNGKVYSDGGVLNNFPIDPIFGKCDLILGSAVNPIEEHHDFTSWRQIAERTYMLSIRNNSIPKQALCDWVVEPQDLVGYGMFDLKKIDELVDIGYKAALAKIKQVHPLATLRA